MGATVQFSCRACGQIYSAWAARCSKCREYGLDPVTAAVRESSNAPAPDVAPPPLRLDPPRLRIVRAPSPEPELDDPVEELADVLPPSSTDPVAITDIAETDFVRDSTGLAPLDHVLGGGLVPASVVLLASPRGIGKSSLTLQALAGLGHRCLYVTGEETREQVAGTARRIGALDPRLFVLRESDLVKIFAHAKALRVQTIAIDSIQKMHCVDISGRPGSPGQLKESAARLVMYAKKNDTAIWIIGHVTGDGEIAGPKTIEHEVDVVLELTKGVKYNGAERVLRCLDKNRFGASDRVGYFTLTDEGLVPVDGDGWDEPL